MERWKPEVKCSEREERLLKLAGKSRKLFVFLREHRHEIFADRFKKKSASPVAGSKKWTAAEKLRVVAAAQARRAARRAVITRGMREVPPLAGSPAGRVFAASCGATVAVASPSASPRCAGSPPGKTATALMAEQLEVVEELPDLAFFLLLNRPFQVQGRALGLRMDTARPQKGRTKVGTISSRISGPAGRKALPLVASHVSDSRGCFGHAELDLPLGVLADVLEPAANQHGKQATQVAPRIDSHDPGSPQLRRRWRA